MKSGMLGLTVILWSLLSRPAVSDVLCASFKPMTAAELNRISLTKGIDKGEYETTADWRRRLDKVFPNPVVAAVRVNDYDEKYDADRRVLNISTVGMTSRSMSGDLDFDTLVLGMHYWSEPGYVGQNAMGVSKQVSVEHYDSFSLYWPHDINRVFDSVDTTIGLPLDPAEAKDLRDHLSIVMVGIPAPPFVHGDYHRSEPTISEPQEGHYYERGLVISPQCAALVDNRTWLPVMMLDPRNLGLRARGRNR